MPAPGSPRARGELLSWLALRGHWRGAIFGSSRAFKRFAQEKIPYAINRYHMEAQRHWGILEERLSARRYNAGRHLHDC